MPTLKQDPMVGLKLLQKALTRGNVRMERCERHPDLQVHQDRPTGDLRITYAAITHGRVRATVVFSRSDTEEGIPAFGIGYAVAEKFRGRGLASTTVRKAIEELRHLPGQDFAGPFYIEAMVAASNDASNRLARRIISDAPVAVTDEVSGEPSFRYLQLVE
jgi:RimJ/RimL family protein N-acetyltransferase